VGRPPSTGEQAKAATSAGPIAWARCQRAVADCTPLPGSPASTLTCTAAVEHIMSRPAVADAPPSARKKASMQS